MSSSQVFSAGVQLRTEGDSSCQQRQMMRIQARARIRMA